MLPKPLSRRALWVGGACALLVMSIWTSFILVARHSAARTLTPFDIAFLRFLFAGLVVLPVVALRWRALLVALAPAGAPPSRAWRRGAALTVLAGVGYCSLAYSGFFFAPAAHAAVLMPGSLPLWTALIALMLFGERLGGWRLAGLGLIVLGDLMVGGSSLWNAFSGDGDTWIGDLLFLAASFCWALYGVVCRAWRLGAVDATLAIAIGCLVSYVPVYALGLAAGVVPTGLGRAPWQEIVFQAAFQGGLSMLVAGVAFTQVVQTFGPQRATMMTALVPALAALAAVPVLGEALGTAAVGGLACVTAGLLLGLRAQPALARPVAVPASIRERTT
jgi:drug/metabolite transporter (DMT)-like permease